MTSRDAEKPIERSGKHKMSSGDAEGYHVEM